MHRVESTIDETDEQKSVHSHHQCPQPAITDIWKMNLTDVEGNVQLGTRVVLNCPVSITGVKKQDIISVNETCGKCKTREQKEHEKEKKDKATDRKTKNENFNKMKKLLVFVILLVVLSQTVLFVLFIKINVPPSRGICVQKLYDGYKELTEFQPRRAWGFDNNCSYNVYLENVRANIKFVIVNPKIWVLSWPHNSLDHDQVFIQRMEEEFTRHRNSSDIQLNDIYYNFVVNYFGKIYEGRPLNCQFEKEEEHFLSENYSAVITVGIPYCFEDRIYPIIPETISLDRAVAELFNSLKSIGVLSQNYSLQFPGECKDRKFVQEILKYHDDSIFYEYTENNLFNYTILSRDIVSLILLTHSDCKHMLLLLEKVSEVTYLYLGGYNRVIGNTCMKRVEEQLSKIWTTAVENSSKILALHDLCYRIDSSLDEVLAKDVGLPKRNQKDFIQSLRSCV